MNDVSLLNLMEIMLLTRLMSSEYELRENTHEENLVAATAIEITGGDITLDFILDERTHEFYGESLRRTDLVRTQSLLARVAPGILWRRNKHSTTSYSSTNSSRSD